MRLPTSNVFRHRMTTDRKPKCLTDTSSAGVQLPDIWIKTNASVSLCCRKQVSKLSYSSLANQSAYCHDFLVPRANQLSPFISQAISSIAMKKMTLDQITQWLQENGKTRTKATDVELCLENCSCFSKAIDEGIVYWHLKYDRLKLQPFGQDIVDTGVAGGIELWQGGHPTVEHGNV